MDNQTQGIFIPYTYTYDQFTVFFYGDRVFLGEKSLPTGQCSVDILNLDEEILMKIYQRVQDFGICKLTGNVVITPWRIF